MTTCLDCPEIFKSWLYIVLSVQTPLTVERKYLLWRNIYFAVLSLWLRCVQFCCFGTFCLTLHLGRGTLCSRLCSSHLNLKMASSYHKATFTSITRINVLLNRVFQFSPLPQMRCSYVSQGSHNSVVARSNYICMIMSLSFCPSLPYHTSLKFCLLTRRLSLFRFSCIIMLFGINGANELFKRTNILHIFPYFLRFAFCARSS